MALQTFELGELPPAPKGKAPEVRRARSYLEATHRSVSGVLDSFNIVREEVVRGRENAQGRLGSDEQDLLRAALVFTSSGLDACSGALVTDCLPPLIARSGSSAHQQFEQYLKDQLAKPGRDFHDSVMSSDPRTAFVQLYIQTRTRASYQGSSDLKKRVRGVLGIPKSLVPDERIESLDRFFEARNSIVHQLDYKDTTGKGKGRRSRSPGHVVQDCQSALGVAAELIVGAAKVLQGQ